METQETELMKMEREEKNKGNGFALLPFGDYEKKSVKSKNRSSMIK